MVADTCILYEVTEYKDESAADDFWEQYMDFFELGEDTDFLKESRIEDQSALTKE